MIPINRFEILGDSIFFEKYAGENPQTNELLRGHQEQLHLAKVAYNIPFETIKTLRNNNGFYEAGDKNGYKHDKKIVESQIITRHYYLGTDNYGRDNLSRLIIGVRISLLVGLIAVIISLTIGVLLGALAVILW